MLKYTRVRKSDGSLIEEGLIERIAAPAGVVETLQVPGVKSVTLSLIKDESVHYELP